MKSILARKLAFVDSSAVERKSLRDRQLRCPRHLPKLHQFQPRFVGHLLRLHRKRRSLLLLIRNIRCLLCPLAMITLVWA